MKKTFLSWSSGKDSAWALHSLRQDPHTELSGLFTVVNREYARVSMHATRVDLLKRQADALKLPIQIIHIPHPCDNHECDAIMRTFVESVVETGIEYMAFGDLFLQEVREYRENQLKDTKIRPLFPLWKTPTHVLAEQMFSSGLEAYVSCVDPQKVSRDLVGRRWSEALIAELPENVDPCGENGAFHSFVTDGPIFRHPVRVKKGETVVRDERFYYCDLLGDADTRG